MRGGPIDLTPFGSLLTGIGIAYWLLALAVAGLALWLLPRWWLKLPVAVLVVGGFIYPVATHVDTQRQQYDVAKERLDKAMALFQERCKTAGEKIHRTVENVEGVVWMKWRSTETNFNDQFKLDDPYGRDCGGKDCIAYLLRVTSGAERNPEDAARHKVGYRFVETTDPTSGARLRYSAAIKVIHVRTAEQIEQYKRNTTGVDPGPNVYGFGLDEQPIDSYTARYGITWDDISTREDREHWIAGGSLKVVDLKTNEVIAERIGYMIDRGQGSEAGFRSPWGFAPNTACPAFERSEANNPVMASRSRFFIYRVLKVKQGD